MTGRGAGGVLRLIRSSPAGADVPVKGGRGRRALSRPLLAPSGWPAGWQVLELKSGACGRAAQGPGTPAGQDRCPGSGGGHELVPAGRGIPVDAREAVIGELGGWPVHRTLGPKPGRDEEPAAGPAGPGLPGVGAGLAGRPRHQGRKARRRRIRRPWPARCAKPFATRTTTSGCGVVRTGNYGAALGDPHRHGSIEPRDCRRSRTRQQANDATDPSAGTAASSCSGP